MKILITGICGFIGFHVANKINNNKNIEVIGIDNLNDYYDVNLKIARRKILNSKKIKILKIDITNKSRLIKLFSKNKFDKVIHLAAQAGVRLSFENPELYFNNNILGFYNVLECCKKFHIQNLIYSSSSSVYGDCKVFPLEESMESLKSVSFYGFTKKNNEELAQFYSRNYGLSIIGLRYFTVYGPYGRPDMSPFLFTNSIINNLPVLLNNNGKHSRDFTNVDDVTDIIDRLIKFARSHDHKIFNICSSSPIKLKNYIKIIEKLLKKKANIIFRDKQLGDVIKTYGSNSKINKFVNKTEYTSIESGMQIYIDWFKDYYQN